MSEMMDRMLADLQTGLKLKRVMIKKGLRQTKAKCPRCRLENLQGRLAGKKNHVRVWCDTPDCKFSQMME